VLTADLAGRPLAAPVLYPGSVERTSAAERHEAKGYVTLEVVPGEDGGELASWAFHELPARAMVDVNLDAAGLGREQLEARLRELLAAIEADAVVRVRVAGRPEPGALTAAAVRALAPPTMTVTLRWGGTYPSA
jgi:DNA repair exonuclease SbcCD nuclease subunit